MMNASKTDATATTADFVISRVLDAPRDLVWKAFTDPERMRHWWGPKGFTVIASKMDLRPGGTYHYGMKAPDGSPMWGKFVFREIVAPERMVFISSFSDEAGGTTRHPMAPTWPLEMLSTFSFEEQPGGKTKVTIRWAPYNATEEERKTFDAGRDSMMKGWGGTLEQLEAYLAKARLEHTNPRFAHHERTSGSKAPQPFHDFRMNSAAATWRRALEPITIKRRFRSRLRENSHGLCRWIYCSRSEEERASLSHHGAQGRQGLARTRRHSNSANVSPTTSRSASERPSRAASR